MPHRLILASGSAIRRDLLCHAGVDVEFRAPAIDEPALRAGLLDEGADPRAIADTLAEYKARKISARDAEAFVIGCDQVIELDGDLIAKPQSHADARAQLLRLRNARHRLHCAVVIYREGTPQWRHLATATLTMRAFSDTYLDGYLARSWPAVQGCAGAYQLEGEGVRLFVRIDGDYFAILGLPLVETLGYLAQRGVIEA